MFNILSVFAVPVGHGATVSRSVGQYSQFMLTVVALRPFPIWFYVVSAHALKRGTAYAC